MLYPGDGWPVAPIDEVLGMVAASPVQCQFQHYVRIMAIARGLLMLLVTATEPVDASWWCACHALGHMLPFAVLELMCRPTIFRRWISHNRMDCGRGTALATLWQPIQHCREAIEEGFVCAASGTMAALVRIAQCVHWCAVAVQWQPSF